MKSQDGSERHVLVIVTTLALDPADEKCKKKLVDRLSDEATVFVAENAEVTDFILINRMKEWD